MSNASTECILFQQFAVAVGAFCAKRSHLQMLVAVIEICNVRIYVICERSKIHRAQAPRTRELKDLFIQNAQV